MLEESLYYFNKAADVLGLSEKVRKILVTPRRVVNELEKVMRRAYRSVRDLAKEKNIDLRTAAFTLAIQRVGRAALSRTMVSEEVDLG